jgi:hypothetical protein
MIVIKVWQIYFLISLRNILKQCNFFLRSCFLNELVLSRVQMKSWAREALETVNRCAFLKRRLIGAC